jgi:hypothetical protein
MLHSPQRMGQMLVRKPDEETPAGSQQLSASPFSDPAEPILRRHAINAETAEKMWNDYHDSRTSAELAKKLTQYSEVSDATKHDLFVSKQQTDPAPTFRDRIERAVEAIHKVAALPREHVETSEKHPKVLAAVMKIIGVGHRGSEE